MDPDAIVINASKGLEDGTLASIDAVYRDVLPARIAARATYLSGPTFASELAAGMPAAIVLAGHDRRDLRRGPAGAVARSTSGSTPPTTCSAC